MSTADSTADTILHADASPKHPFVRFIVPGIDEVVLLPVSRFCVFVRGPNGTCALCDGDPCNERSAPNSPIARFYANSPHAVSCPVCDGRPS